MNTVHDSSLDDLYHCLRVVPAVRDDEDAQQSTPYGDLLSSSLLVIAPATPLIFASTHDTLAISSPSTPLFESRDPPWPTPNPNPNTSHEPKKSRMQLRRGPIVPQERDRPFTLSDRRRYVDAVDLRPSIVFNIHDPHEERFSLSAAIPINALPGYDHAWGLQTLTRDVHNPPVTATRAKLAKDVAKSVSRFLAKHKPEGHPMEEDDDPAWCVGPGKIDVSDLVIVRLDHVSKGSWQARLQTIRPRS